MDGLCFDDLDEFGRELDDLFAELEQDVVHMLLEIFGTNPDDPTRGGGLVAALSGPANRLSRTKALIEAQLHDDVRVTHATCAITATGVRGEYRVDLVLEVNAVELELAYLVDATGGVRRAS